jgi:ABC-2 type transport system permease protein
MSAATPALEAPGTAVVPTRPTARPGTVLRGALRDGHRGLIGWPVAIAAVATMYTSFYPSIGATKLEVMLDAMPGFAEAMGFEDMISAAGYVGTTVYSLLGAVLTLVCAISLGGRLIAGDEEAGTLELDFAAPVTRTRVYLERLAVLWLTILLLAVTVTVVLLLLSWLMDLGLAPLNVVAASTGLLLFGGALGTLAFAMGAATGRRSTGVGIASSVAVLAYLFSYLGPLIGASWMETVSPFSWYLGNDPVLNGFDTGGLVLLAALALVVGADGLMHFRVRDLSV